MVNWLTLKRFGLFISTGRIRSIRRRMIKVYYENSEIYPGAGRENPGHLY